MNKAEITITSHSQEMKRGTVGQTSLRENKLLIRLLQIQQLSWPSIFQTLPWDEPPY